MDANSIFIDTSLPKGFKRFFFLKSPLHEHVDLDLAMLPSTGIG